MSVFLHLTRWLFACLAVLMFAGAALLSDEPIVAEQAVPNAADVGATQTMVQMILGALRSPDGTVVAARKEDLPAAARVLSYSSPQLRVSATLEENGAPLAFSYRLAARTWLNGRAEVEAFEQGELPQIAASLGAVDVPPPLARWLADRGLEILWPADAGTAAPRLGDLVRSTQVGREHIAVQLRLPRELLRTARRLLIGQSDRAEREAKETFLHLTSPSLMFRQPDELTELLNKAFADGPASPEEAFGRLTGVLMASYNPAMLRLAAPEVLDHKSCRPRPIRATIAGRHDLALHFLISATIAARGESDLANALGEMKELSDALPGGSGFSFVDLAADRAGQRLGELLRTPETSARTQRALAAVQPGGLFPAEALGMQEGLTNEEFERRFGALEGSRYNAALERIDRALTSLPLYSAEPRVSRSFPRQERRILSNGGG